jgi:hypothetical protein
MNTGSVGNKCSKAWDDDDDALSHTPGNYHASILEILIDISYLGASWAGIGMRITPYVTGDEAEQTHDGIQKGAASPACFRTSTIIPSTS